MSAADAGRTTTAASKGQTASTSAPGGPLAAIPVRWRRREPPLLPTGVLARGPALLQLVRRLRERDDDGLALLRAVVGSDVLVVLGPPDLLPWSDGARYLGRDPAAPSLLLPTTLEPEVPVALLERALLRSFRDAAPPLAVLPEIARVLALGPARALSAAGLRARWPPP